MTPPVGGTWSSAWVRLGRTLTFRLSRADVEAFDWRCLALGLGFVWLVGVGRHWDDMQAMPFQQLGLASLLYSLLLAWLLWLIALPVANRPIQFHHALTFVAMAAPPGLIYALPVEWWTDADTAAALNAWALAFVAAYRVGLLAIFYKRVADLSVAAALLLTAVPLVAVMVFLGLTRLGPVIARGMSGIRDGAPSAAERLDEIVVNLGFMALVASPVVAVMYLLWLVRIYNRRTRTHGRAA